MPGGTMTNAALVTAAFAFASALIGTSSGVGPCREYCRRLLFVLEAAGFAVTAKV
jgi:hypothetical protein